MKPLAERVTLAGTSLGRVEGLVALRAALDAILEELKSGACVESREELIDFQATLQSMTRTMARLGAAVRPRLAIVGGEMSDAG